MKTSLSFILNEKDSDKIRMFSEQLNFNFGEFIPHFTLMFFDHETNIKDVEDLKLDVVVQGLYFDLDDKERYWVGLALKKTKAFERIFSIYSQKYPPVEDYDKFFPHITLGCLSADRLNSVDISRIQGLSQLRSFDNVPLRYCRNGEFGKVTEILS